MDWKRLLIFPPHALGVVVLAAGYATPVEAASVGPVASGSPVQANVVQKAAWDCRGRRCTWLPGYRGPIPGYARTWGPPRFPHCYWKKGLLGRWKYKCDDDWD